MEAIRLKSASMNLKEFAALAITGLLIQFPLLHMFQLHHLSQMHQMCQYMLPLVNLAQGEVDLGALWMIAIFLFMELLVFYHLLSRCFSLTWNFPLL